MGWKKDGELEARLRGWKLLDQSRNCPDCGVEPGNPHETGCDVERCSVCGRQCLMSNCKGHDKYFARWTGFWPGYLECLGLGMVSELNGTYSADLNTFYSSELYKQFLIKPRKK